MNSSTLFDVDAQELHARDLAQDAVDWAAWRDFSKAIKLPDGSTPSPSREWSTALRVEGMHCAACAIRVENTLTAIPGVLNAQVNFSANTARVHWATGAGTPLQWAQTLASAGYRATPLQAQEPQANQVKESRLALWRMLVSGFCMMQIMMYSVPTYLAQPGDITPDMELLLRWASWVLVLPVLLFACGPFWKSAWRDAQERHISMDLPVALGIVITFVVSSWATFSGPTLLHTAVYFDSLSMFVFFLLVGRWFELKLREKTTGSLEALMSKMPQTVEKITPNGLYKRVNVSALKVGDVIRVKATEVFPCDAQVLQGESWVEEALLNGESKPIAKNPGQDVLAGSHNLSQALELRVTRLGPDTRYAQIIDLMLEASFSKPRMVKVADQVAKPFLFSVLVAAFICAAYWWDQGPAHALMIAVSVLIVTCPCALSLAAPVALLASAGNLARHGIYIRNLHSLEVLAKTQTVVFDKTGTLTQDRQTIERVYTPEGLLDWAQMTPSQQLALETTIGLAQSSWHPLSRTLFKDLSLQLGLSAQEAQPLHLLARLGKVREVSGQGLEADSRTEGLKNSALPASLRLGSLEFCEAWAAPAAMDPVARNAQVHLFAPKSWMASFVMSENIRSDAYATLAQLQAMNKKTYLLSGDLSQAVDQVAQHLGFDKDTVHSRMNPADKLRFVSDLQHTGEVVATVGDGFNDLPAMAKTDVSIAFGKAIPITQARADVVVLSDQLWAVPQLLALSKKTMTVIHQNLLWAGLYNLTCVPLAVMGLFPPWAAGLGMAASSLWVVFHASQLAQDRALIEST